MWNNHTLIVCGMSHMRFNNVTKCVFTEIDKKIDEVEEQIKAVDAKIESGRYDKDERMQLRKEKEDLRAEKRLLLQMKRDGKDSDTVLTFCNE